jgi:hypothetical protein
MSATTMAVAVNHGTPVDGPPDAELGMTDSPPAPQHYTVQLKKFNRRFQLFLRRLGPSARPRKNARQRRARAGEKNLDGPKTCSPVSYASATGSS